MVVGPSISGLIDEYPQNEKQIRRLFYLTNPKIIRWAKERGFLPYVPYQLGGFGLPHPRGRHGIANTVPARL